MKFRLSSGENPRVKKLENRRRNSESETLNLKRKYRNYDLKMNDRIGEERGEKMRQKIKVKPP